MKTSKFLARAVLSSLALMAVTAHAAQTETKNDVKCETDSKADQICMAIPKTQQSAAVKDTTPPAPIRILAKDELSGGAAPNPPAFMTDASAASLKEEGMTNLSIKDAMKSQEEMRAVEFYLKSGPAGASNNISTVPTVLGKPKK